MLYLPDKPYHEVITYKGVCKCKDINDINLKCNSDGAFEFSHHGCFTCTIQCKKCKRITSRHRRIAKDARIIDIDFESKARVALEFFITANSCGFNLKRNEPYLYLPNKPFKEEYTFHRACDCKNKYKVAIRCIKSRSKDQVEGKSCTVFIFCDSCEFCELS